MKAPRKCTATKSLLALALLCMAGWLQAAPAIGTVSHLSGPLFVKKADGSARVLASQSSIDVGDSLTTTGEGYAQVRFNDDSVLTLAPGTVITLERFTYYPSVPADDRVLFTLQQGGVQVEAGKLARRSLDRVALETPIGRLEMQGASAVVQYVPPPTLADALMQRLNGLTGALALSAQRGETPLVAFIAMPLSRALHHMVDGLTPLMTIAPSAGGLAPGLYVQVIDGLIKVGNPTGTQSFAAGQFGYTATVTQPPVIVPNNPGVQFAPPPAFNVSVAGDGTTSSTQSTGVDCMVR